MFIFNYEDSDKVMFYDPPPDENFICSEDFIGFFESYELNSIVTKNLEFFIDGIKSFRGNVLRPPEFINKNINISVVVVASGYIAEHCKQLLKKIFDEFGNKKEIINSSNGAITPSSEEIIMSDESIIQEKISHDNIFKINSKTVELLKDIDFQNLCKICLKNPQYIKDFTNYISNGRVINEE